MGRAVLIVDDDQPLLTLLQTVVSREPDVEIVTCCDGEQAIRALSERHFDVVLLDLMMPRRSGFEVIDYLRQNRPRQLRMVLVLTAVTDEVTHALDPNVVHAVIDKPFDIHVMSDFIHGLLDAADELQGRG